jgi:hypothetical protein
MAQMRSPTGSEFVFLSGKNRKSSAQARTEIAGKPTTTTTSASTRWYPDHVVYNATKEELKAMPEFKY